jgi:hypothetical protein
MTRSRRLGTALTLFAAAAALSIGGAAASAASAASVPAEDAPGNASVLTEVPQLNPQPEASRGRGGYGYPTTPPAGEVPSTPPGGEVPSTPPGGELPSTAPAGEVPSPTPGGVSPGQSPGGELPVTGSPLVFVAAAGGLLAAAGVGLRFAARRRRP